MYSILVYIKLDNEKLEFFSSYFYICFLSFFHSPHWVDAGTRPLLALQADRALLEGRAAGRLRLLQEGRALHQTSPKIIINNIKIFNRVNISPTESFEIIC